MELTPIFDLTYRDNDLLVDLQALGRQLQSQSGSSRAVQPGGSGSESHSLLGSAVAFIAENVHDSESGRKAGAAASRSI